MHFCSFQSKFFNFFVCFYLQAYDSIRDYLHFAKHFPFLKRGYHFILTIFKVIGIFDDFQEIHPMLVDFLRKGFPKTRLLSDHLNTLTHLTFSSVLMLEFERDLKLEMQFQTFREDTQVLFDSVSLSLPLLFSPFLRLLILSFSLTLSCLFILC